MATYNTLPARARRLTAPVGTYLTDEQIRQVAPSVYASTAHASRSAGFAPIPTSEILIGLRREGRQDEQRKQHSAILPRGSLY